jgi:hypothetical protein
MMTVGNGRSGRDAGKHWRNWGVRNRYGWWWIDVFTAQSWPALRRMWYADQASMTARSGRGPSAPTGTAVFGVRRGGERIMVRANRYALAASLDGAPLEPWVRALHGCNNPACARVLLMMGRTARRRGPPGGAPRGPWREGAPSSRGRVARCGAQWLGCRCGGHRITGLEGTNAVVSAAWRIAARPPEFRLARRDGESRSAPSAGRAAGAGQAVSPGPNRGFTSGTGAPHGGAASRRS